jgi:hypothetical protein
MHKQEQVDSGEEGELWRMCVVAGGVGVMLRGGWGDWEHAVKHINSRHTVGAVCPGACQAQ